MKYILIIALTLLVMCSAAIAGGDPKAESKSYSNADSKSYSNSDSKSYSDSYSYSQSGDLYSDNYAHTGDMNLHNEFNGRVQHVAPIKTEECIGSVCRSTSSIFVTGGYDEYTGNSVNIGINIPLGSSVTKRGLDLESQRLEDRNRQEREKHQAEMAQMCMVLHEKLSIVDGLSDELKARCYAYVPHHEHIATGQARRHNAFGNKDQASPHAEQRSSITE